MRGRILFGFIFFSFSLLQAQKFECFLSENSYKHELDLHFTTKAQKFKSPMEYASVNFPELKGLEIEVRRKHITTMMAARPRIDFIFRKRENRKYVVYITDLPEMNAGPIFAEMSQCAQAGVLGHELSHIVTYNKMNNMQLVWFSMKYMFNRRKIETETDIIAMKHGFGDELIEYTRYILKSPHTNRKYLRKKKRLYLSANEIKEKLLILL